jgi:ABC-type polysaccharide/polyol phosphate transport system ATPase subunit
MKPVIILDNINVRYRAADGKIGTFKEYVIQLLKRRVRFKEFSALKNINLQVNEGELVGVIGHNGAGKIPTQDSPSELLPAQKTK